MFFRTINRFQTALPLVFAGLFFGVTYCTTGFYWAWIDDIQEMNLFSGMIHHCYLVDRANFIFLGQGFIWLYQHAPTVPWYGLFIYLMLFISLVNTLLAVKRFLFLNINSAKGIAAYFFLSLIFFLIVFYEHVLAVNFTSVVILLSGSCLLLFFQETEENKGKRTKKILLFSLLILAGFMREEAMYLTGIIAFMGYWLIMGISKPLLRKTVIGLIPFLIVFIACTTYRHFDNSTEGKSFKAIISYLFTSQDTYDYKTLNLKTDEDSTKYLAVKRWNHFDKYVITPEYLKSITYAKPRMSFDVGSIVAKINRVLALPRLYQYYHLLYNWIAKDLWLLLLTFLIAVSTVTISIHSTQKRMAVRLLLAYLVFILAMIVITLLVKMENRVLYPLTGLFTIATFCLFIKSVVENNYRHKLLFGFNMLLLVCFSSYYLVQYLQLARELKLELCSKESFQSELNQKFGSKHLIFDMHALYLLHRDPFHEVSVNRDNVNVAGHYYLRHYKCIQDYYRERCGSDRIDKIMDYLYQNRSDVVFVYSEENMEFLQHYLHTIYHSDYAFHKIAGDFDLRNIHFSFMPQVLTFHYYLLEKTTKSD